jgi:putative sterol carrier protein
LALKTTFRPDLADGFESTVELRLDDDLFHAEIANGQAVLTRGPASGHPDAVIEATVGTFRSLTFGARPLVDALQAGDVRVDGDADSAARFLTLFPRPS